MSTYERTVTPDEIEALFISGNPSMTTAQKQAYLDLFNRIKREKPLSKTNTSLEYILYKLR